MRYSMGASVGAEIRQLRASMDMLTKQVLEHDCTGHAFKNHKECRLKTMEGKVRAKLERCEEPGDWQC